VRGIWRVRLRSRGRLPEEMDARHVELAVRREEQTISPVDEEPVEGGHRWLRPG
jgi:hypothetical protein